MFHGIITALVTPFKNGKIDEKAFREHIEWQIQSGIHGLLPCGTTGESATLSHDEHEEVIRICIDQVKGRVPVIAGAGSNNTLEAIRLTEFAKKAGADATLHISPYYNKPSQEGLFQHFKAISSAVDLPLYLYNVPSRTGVNILPKTVARIFNELEHVVGIKEATANITQFSEVAEFCSRKICLLSGDDFTLLPSLALGAAGIISVSSNIVPEQMVRLYTDFMAGNLKESQNMHFHLQELHRALFIDVNPVPVKTGLSLMGKMEMEVRLPLCATSQQNVNELKKALATVNIHV